MAPRWPLSASECHKSPLMVADGARMPLHSFRRDPFAFEQPWCHFPWEAAFGPRSKCEDELRQAIGLRELPQLTKLIDMCESNGLTKRNSRVFFEVSAPDWP